MLLTRQLGCAMLETMNDIKREKITQLAIDAHRKRKVIDEFKNRPIPADDAAKEKNAVEFALAMTDSIEAEGLLRQEMGIAPQGPMFQQN
jgi:hypothetical protein